MGVSRENSKWKHSEKWITDEILELMDVRRILKINSMKLCRKVA